MITTIDKQKCLGCGICVDICPEAFELINGKAKIKNSNIACIKNAAQRCPRQAIIINYQNLNLTNKQKTKQINVKYKIKDKLRKKYYLKFIFPFKKRRGRKRRKRGGVNW